MVTESRFLSTGIRAHVVASLLFLFCSQVRRPPWSLYERNKCSFWLLRSRWLDGNKPSPASSNQLLLSCHQEGLTRTHSSLACHTQWLTRLVGRNAPYWRIAKLSKMTTMGIFWNFNLPRGRFALLPFPSFSSLSLCTPDAHERRSHYIFHEGYCTLPFFIQCSITHTLQ